MNKMSLRKPVIAAHWGPKSLEYVVADRKAGQVRITTAAAISWAEEEDDQRSPGDVLLTELQRLGLRRLDLIQALGRGSVDVIPLQLPPSSDEELPTLVFNQVMRDAGDIAETGVVDFVALPADPGEPRAGFAFAVDAATLEQINVEAAKASLKPSTIVYRPLASVTLLRRVVPQSQQTMILVTLHNREADISIVRGGGLAYTRTARLSETKNVGDIAAQLAMEVRRSLAAASLAPDAESQHLYMFGMLQETEQLVQDLAEELSLPASLLDPLRAEQVDGPTPDGVGRLSPLLGMIYDHYAKSHATDFLHPKEPPPPPNQVRQVAGYVAAAMLVVVIGGYMMWESRAKAAEELAGIRSTLTKTTERLEKVKQKRAVVDAVWQWQGDNVNWLDEFYDLARRFPSGRDAMIRRFSVSPGRGGASVIDLNVHVRDPAVVTQMEDQLRDAYHDVRCTGVSEQAAAGDYPWQFETRITLRPRDTDEYRKNAPDSQSEEEPSGDFAANSMISAAKK